MHAVGRREAQEEPLNREPDVQDLVSSYLTTRDAYDRNHGPIPSIPSACASDTTASNTTTLFPHSEYALSVHPPFSSANEGAAAISLTLSDLKSKYKHVTITAALQCAGNRRHTMRTRLKEVQGIDWGDGAIMNCTWTGVRVCDVLAATVPDVKTVLQQESKPESEGMHDEWKVKWHAQFECNKQECQEEGWYGASIPLQRAMSGEADVLLAFGMNGEPLSEAHGAPLRLIVPGICGARSVKWLDTIRISQQESANHYQQKDYKILPPGATDAESAEPYWDKIPPLLDMPVNSVVASPQSEEEVKMGGDGIKITGYAVPAGMDGPIVKVETSVDDGQNWTTAELLDKDQTSQWAWMRWRTRISRSMLDASGVSFSSEGKVNVTILSRATDKGGNVQDGCEWNLRGVAYNGYGEARDVSVRLQLSGKW